MGRLLACFLLVVPLACYRLSDAESADGEALGGCAPATDSELAIDGDMLPGHPCLDLE